MALTREDCERFLALPHTAALSVDAGPGRGPLTVPVWYWYEPGGDVRVLTNAESRKARLIEAAGRFGLMVQTTEPTFRYVSVEGPLVDTRPGDLDTFRALAARYLAPESVDYCVEYSARCPSVRVVLHMRPQRWLSSDFGAPTPPNGTAPTRGADRDGAVGQAAEEQSA